MKKIIVPTDFSDSAMNALKVAAQLAWAKNDIEIHLVHVYERPVSGITLQFEIDNAKLREVKKHILNKMNDLCDQKFIKGLKITKHFIADKEIWEFADDPKFADADLI